MKLSSQPQTDGTNRRKNIPNKAVDRWDKQKKKHSKQTVSEKNIQLWSEKFLC